MILALSLIFLVIAFLLIALTLLAMIYLGFRRLQSSVGIRRDGIPYGKRVPGWNLSDTTGQIQMAPTGEHWQFLLFIDHSLKAFPGLATGINHVSQSNSNLKVLIMARGNKEECENIIQMFDLQVPVIPVDQTFYNRFKVRVMPFGILVDPNGIVCWLGLVNTGDELATIWQLTQKRVSRDLALKGEMV